LHRLEDIAGFVLLTPPLFHTKFRSVPVAPDRPCWDQPAHKYSNLCDHGNWTSQTDGQTTYCGITTLCIALHSKTELGRK